MLPRVAAVRAAAAPDARTAARRPHRAGARRLPTHRPRALERGDRREALHQRHNR